MTNDELKTLIDQHAAAMKAQVDMPSVQLEWLDVDKWKAEVRLNQSSRMLVHAGGTYERTWHRIAPPKPVRRKAWVHMPDLHSNNSVASFRFEAPPAGFTANWLPIEWDEPPAPPPTPPARECWINWYPKHCATWPTRDEADRCAAKDRIACQRVVMEGKA